MASASSYNAGFNKSTAYANVNLSTGTERNSKRKLDDIVGLTNDDDSRTPWMNKRPRINPNTEHNKVGKTLDDGGPTSPRRRHRRKLEKPWNTTKNGYRNSLMNNKRSRTSADAKQIRFDRVPNDGKPTEPAKGRKRKIEESRDSPTDWYPKGSRSEKKPRTSARAEQDVFDKGVEVENRSAQGNPLNKKHEDRENLTRGGESNDYINKKKPQTVAGALLEEYDRAVEAQKAAARSKRAAASNGARPRKEAAPKTPRKETPCEEETRKAKSSFGNENGAEAQLPFELLFECGTCHKSFKKLAELDDHEVKHKQQQQPENVAGSNDDGIKHKQQPRFPCRKCHEDFATPGERDHHFQTSTSHLLCRYCKQSAGEFRSAESLRYHYIDHHHELYCHFCDRHFVNAFQCLSHMDGRHWPCSACSKMTPRSDLHEGHCQTCYPAKFGKPFPKAQKRDSGNTKALPNHYARLGVSVDSSHEQVLKAAKEMRVKTHPDRLKRKEGLTVEEERAIDVEAALVGQAADILSDPILREKYDRNVHGL